MTSKKDSRRPATADAPNHEPLTGAQIIQLILKEAEGKYSLEEFNDLGKPIREVLSIFPQTVSKGKGAGETKYFIRCFKRNIDIEVWSPQRSNPAEIIRQLYIYKLTAIYNYPIERVFVPFQLTPSDQEAKPADLVVTQEDQKTPYIIVVTETPARREGIDRLLGYLVTDGAELGVWSNGGERYIVHRKRIAHFQDDALPDLPRADQTVAELLDAPLRVDKHLRREFDFRKVILRFSAN